MKVLKTLLVLLLLISITTAATTCVKFAKVNPQELIANAEAQAETIIADADSEANAISLAADEEASKIIADAKKERDRKIAEAKAKAEAEAKKAKRSSPFHITFPLSLSDSDRDLLYRICNAEDGDAGKAGVQAVCWVILNRMASPKYPNNVYGVVYDKRFSVQFTPTVNGHINKRPSQEVVDAVDEVLAGNVPDPTGGALFFAMPYAATGDFWENDVVYVGHIGSHNFYRDP